LEIIMGKNSTQLETADLLLTRRRLLTAGASIPVAALALKGIKPAAAAETTVPANAKQNSFALGEFTVSTLLAGTRTADNPQAIFGMNVTPEEFAEVSEQNFIPADKNQFFFTPTVVNAGGQTVLFDTGLNPAGITGPLAEAGIKPEDVDIIVLTHMHGDHIGGLMNDDGTPTFANARYVTGQAEFDAWAKMDNENFDKKVKPLADKMSFIGDGGSVVSGITGMAATGHTPGHMIYMLESAGEQLVIAADTANHYVWSLAYPEWEVKFDMDKAKAAASRKAVFGMLAADRIPFIGYHMPFPGTGFVETRGEGGFRYVPSSYQMMM
jgi:glyoxylase-like metal-dependent hydrolase (beta-lactamase superfamily II)